MSIKLLVLFVTVFLIGLCFAEDDPVKSDRSEFKKSFFKECSSPFSIRCFKLNIVYWVDKLDEKSDYIVLPGVSVVRENRSESIGTKDIVKEVARQFPNDPDARLDAYLLNKVSGYLNNHSIKLNLWSNSVDVEEGRGKGGGGGGGGKKGGGGMEYLIAAGAMMKGTLMALAFGGLAAIAGKALMTAMISLLISGIIGLKSLTHSDHKSTTYEIVSKPIYTHANTHSASHEEQGHHGHSSYRRSLEVPLPLGLQPNYKPEQQF